PSVPAEIAFIDFDLAGHFRRFLGEPFCDDDAQPVVELGRGDFVRADEQTRCSSWRPGNKVFQQLIRLNML
ncbi:MAG: hypothetical protein AAGL18_12815, partial [Pseudomonadota bacterium]